MVLFLSTTLANAQEQSAATEKKFEHRIGVQANELIRQVFNFSNSANNANTNPYVLTYSINSVRRGWGARVGIGYIYRNLSDDDGVVNNTSDLHNMNFRLGVEKAFQLNKRWSVGAGLDALYNSDYNKTKAVTRGFDTTITLTKTNVSSIGGGAMGWIRFAVTRNIEVGTETSFYYTQGDKKQDISITTREFSGTGFPGNWTTSVSKTDDKQSVAQFRMPVAIYLLVKF